MSQLEGNKSAKEDPLRSIFLAENASEDDESDQILDQILDRFSSGIGPTAVRAMYGRLQISLLLSRGPFAGQDYTIETRQRLYGVIQERLERSRGDLTSTALANFQADY